MSLHPNFTSIEVQNHAEKLLLVKNFYDGVDTAALHIIQYSGESNDDYKKRLKCSAIFYF